MALLVSIAEPARAGECASQYISIYPNQGAINSANSDCNVHYGASCNEGAYWYQSSNSCAEFVNWTSTVFGSFRWSKFYDRQSSGTGSYACFNFGEGNCYGAFQLWSNPPLDPADLCVDLGSGLYDCSGLSIPDEARQRGPQQCSIDPGVSTELPINFAIGNKYLVETYYSGTGTLPLDATLYYNSDDGVWRHSYAAALDLSVGTATYARRADGKVLTFYPNASGWVSAFSDQREQLDYDSANDEWVLTTSEDLTERYDSTGKLLSITNRAGQSTTLTYVSGELDTVAHFTGRTLSFTYDGNGNLATITDPAGEVYGFTLDASGRLTEVSYPDDTPANPSDNPTRVYHYEDTSFPTSVTGITDENGSRHSTYAYDTQGRATLSELSGTAYSRSVAYTGANTVTLTNSLGKDTVFTLVEQNGIRRISQANGQPTAMCGATTRSLTYDANGYVDTRTDEEGNVTGYDYDSRGLLTSKTEADGTADERTTTTTWHADFRVPTQIVKPGQTIDMTYDTSGRLLTRTITDTQTQSVPYTTTNNTRTWTYTYNAFGLVATVDGPRTDVSNVTTYGYDVNGNLTSITNALSQVTEITARDARGYPTEIEDINDVVTELTYGPRGWLTSRTVKSSQGDAVTTFDYDAVGQVTGITLPDGSELLYEYDAAHRLTAIENGLGERIEYTLDAAGNRTAENVKDTGGSITRTLSRVYDELSRLRDSLGANGQSTDLDYDDNDNLTQIEDGLSRITGQSFDALDRLIEVTDPALNDATYDYDDRDNLTQVTDPGGVATSYVYDGLDNLIQESSPDAGTTVHEYDAAGNLTETTDGRGIVVQYSYDALNRLTGISYPASTGENVTYTYDTGTNGLGRLRSVTDESGTTTYTYDDRGNVLSVSRNTGSETFVTSYTYDLADNIASITYPSGRTVTYNRDSLGRVSGVSGQIPGEASETLASSITYEPFGPMATWTSGNGVANTRTFDQDYRVTDIEISGTGLLHNLAYGYNVVDNVTSLTDGLNASLSQTFDYDVLDRLSDADGDYGDQSYSYDANGNRTQRDNATTLVIQTLTYTTGTNELATEDSQAVAHDGAGHRTSDNGGTRTYAYNHAGRMTQFTESSVVQADYTYNAQGQRVKKVRHVGASDYVRNFFYDQAGQLIGEYRDNPDGTYAYVDYVWLNGAPLVQEERSYNSSDVLTETQTTWLHVDHLNTPRIGTNESKVIVWRWDSDPFGVGAADSDPDNDSTDHVVLLRFPGQNEDEESEHYYNYFRDYDPATGRYIESDPIGLVGGLNVYGYVHQNPIHHTDPTGQAVPAVIAACAANPACASIVATAVRGTLGGLIGGLSALEAVLGNPCFDGRLAGAVFAGAAVGAATAAMPGGGTLGTAVARGALSGAGGNAMGQVIPSRGAENFNPASNAAAAVTGGFAGAAANVTGLASALAAYRRGQAYHQALATGASEGAAAATVLQFTGGIVASNVNSSSPDCQCEREAR